MKKRPPPSPAPGPMPPAETLARQQRDFTDEGSPPPGRVGRGTPEQPSPAPAPARRR